MRRDRFARLQIPHGVAGNDRVIEPPEAQFPAASLLYGPFDFLYRPVTSSDLTPEYVAALRRTTGQQKWKTALTLYWGARKLKAAALRQQHPDWTDGQIQEKMKQIFLHAGG